MPSADLAVGAHVARKREPAVIGSVLAVQHALVELVPARVTVRWPWLPGRRRRTTLRASALVVVEVGSALESR